MISEVLLADLGFGLVGAAKLNNSAEEASNSGKKLTHSWKLVSLLCERN